MLALLLMAQTIPATQAGVNSPIAVPVQGVTNGKPVPVDASGSTITVNGVSTAANQTNVQSTPGTSAGTAITVQGSATGVPQPVTGNVASGTTDSGNGVKVSGVYLTTLPVSTTGQRVDMGLYRNGALMVGVSSNGNAGSDAQSQINSFLSGSGTSPTQSPFPVAMGNFGFNGSLWDRGRTLQATDMGSGLGVNAVGIVPTSAASQAIPYTTVFGAATSVLKASAGNLYGINANNSTTASFVVAFNGTSAPTSGTALTAANVSYCFALPASQSSDKVFNPPVRMGTGITLLISTSCTTYTTPGVLPLTLTGYFQ